MSSNRSYTDAEVSKLIDCEIEGRGGKWVSGYKFLRRGQRYVVTLFMNKPNEWLKVSYPYSKVKVKGRTLEYIGKYQLTNIKKPFLLNS